MTITAATRASLASSAEHLFAVLKLGDNYTNDEYIKAVTAARKLGVGEAYVDKVAGPDVDALLGGVVEDEDEVLRAVEARLRDRGIEPKAASYDEYSDALTWVGQS
jgi:hypothetical protein